MSHPVCFVLDSDVRDTALLDELVNVICDSEGHCATGVSDKKGQIPQF